MGNLCILAKKLDGLRCKEAFIKLLSSLKLNRMKCKRLFMKWLQLKTYQFHSYNFWQRREEGLLKARSFFNLITKVCFCLERNLFEITNVTNRVEYVESWRVTNFSAHFYIFLSRWARANWIVRLNLAVSYLSRICLLMELTSTSTTRTGTIHSEFQVKTIQSDKANFKYPPMWEILLNTKAK